MNNRMLNDRAQHLLKTLVERYIEDGQPVGSRTLAKSSSLKISPATVRNVMSDLEEMGLIHAPHTSAGRVPTVTGYRLFVDSLLTVTALGDIEVEGIRGELGIDKSVSGLLDSASGLLSDITHMAGVVTLPQRDMISLRQIEFLPLSQDRVLVILVTNEQEVENFIIHTSKPYSASELVQLANYLTETYSGQDLKRVRQMLSGDLQDAHSQINRMMADSVEVAQKALTLDESKENDLFVTGETNLIHCMDMSDMSRLRSMFNTFSDKQEMLSLLDQCITGDGVRIYIGEESGRSGFGDCSVISSPYKVNGETVGALAVIGPTRMEYNRVIPVVDVTAKILSAALNTHKTDN